MIVVVFLLVLSVSLVSIALQNTIYIPLKFLFWTVNTSLALSIIGSFVVGLLAGLIFAIPNLVKKSLKLSGQNKSLANLKKELEVAKENPKPEKI